MLLPNTRTSLLYKWATLSFDFVLSWRLWCTWDASEHFFNLPINVRIQSHLHNVLIASTLLRPWPRPVSLLCTRDGWERLTELLSRAAKRVRNGRDEGEGVHMCGQAHQIQKSWMKNSRNTASCIAKKCYWIAHCWSSISKKIFYPPQYNWEGSPEQVTNALYITTIYLS